MTLRVFVDTTLSGASVAFVFNEKPSQIAWSGFHPQRSDSDSALSKMLEEGLAHLGKKTEDIECIVVSHGPGSFTGIKVGLAWAYGFQAARKENLLYGVSALAEGNAELQKRESNPQIALLLPISRREAFLSLQMESKESVFSSIVLFSEQAASELKTLADRNFVCFVISEKGEADLKVKSWLQTLGVPCRDIEILEFMKLALAGMVHKAAVQNLSKQRTIAPQYLKKTTVEEKLGLGN